MHQPVSRHTTLRRLLLFTASLGVGAVGWFLLGEPPELNAEESSGTSAVKVVARVDGIEISEALILDKVSGELRELERERERVIAEAVRDEVRRRMLTLESTRRGIDTRKLLAIEVDGKLAEIPQDRVDAFFASHPFRQPKATVEGRIRRTLALEALEERLRERYPVEVLLGPPGGEIRELAAGSTEASTASSAPPAEAG